MIALVRVDNRLVHGQILEAWMPRLRATALVVADDDAARSPLARAAMTLAVPITRKQAAAQRNVRLCWNSSGLPLQFQNRRLTSAPVIGIALIATSTDSGVR